MMNFFEALRRKAFKPYQFDEGYTVFERAAILGVVDATIEALKEMVLGEPIFINDVNEHDALYPFLGKRVWLIPIEYEEKD